MVNLIKYRSNAQYKHKLQKHYADKQAEYLKNFPREATFVGGQPTYWIRTDSPNPMAYSRPIKDASGKWKQLDPRPKFEGTTEAWDANASMSAVSDAKAMRDRFESYDDDIKKIKEEYNVNKEIPNIKILEDKVVYVQGIGHVGEVLVQHLTNEGAIVTISDINESRLHEVGSKYGAKIFSGNDMYSLDVDIYAPCALGATINDETISKIQVKVIAGAANNQLANELIHGKLLKEKGILYAPDFLINAGGVINVYSELANLTSAQVMEKTENIYNTAMDIFRLSDDQNITTHQAALNIAQKRIDDRKKELQNK